MLTTHNGPAEFLLLLVQLLLFQGQEYLSPHITRFSDIIGQVHVGHANSLAQILELTDQVVETKCFSHGLCSTCF
jgi:hypothetical protein